jgi:DNA sulfur modification protein DndD
MKIHSLEVKNFRGFYGEHRIEFSVDPEKNITLIHAENGVGKTTLLNAILWCFYGKRPSGFQGDIQNKHSQDKKEQQYFVSVIFEENNIKYQARRSSNLFDKEDFEVQEIEDGNSVLHHAATEFINSIIPEEIAPYFFFKGEGNKKFSIDNGSDIQKAIRDILGIKIAEQALYEIKKAEKEYLKKLQQEDISKEMKEATEEVRRLKASIESENGLIKQNKDTIEKSEHIINENNRLIRNSNHKELKHKQKQIEGLETEKLQIKRKEKKETERKIHLITKYAASAFCEKINSANLDFVEADEGEGLIHSPHSDLLVQEIVKKLECICGRTFEKRSPEMENIKALLANARDSVLEKRIADARATQAEIQNNLKYALTEFSSGAEAHSEILKDKELNKIALNGAKKELERIIPTSEIDPQVIGQETTNAQTKKNEALSSNGAANQRKTNYEGRLNRAQATLDRLASKNSNAGEYKSIIDFIGKIAVKLGTAIKDAESSAKPTIKQKINEFLNQYASKGFHVEIDDKFNISLYDSDVKVQQKSDGEERLLSLTFISSLISFSKIRKGASGSILTPGAVAPFILDAPFGDLDADYGDSIAQYLPLAVDQVVLLLSTRHWSGGIEKVIRGKIGKEYNIVHEETAEQGEKEKKYITILGKDYEKVRYSMDIKTSVVEEVNK